MITILNFKFDTMTFGNKMNSRTVNWILNNYTNVMKIIANCSDPLEGGGTIYSNGFFFFVQ